MEAGWSPADFSDPLPTDQFEGRNAASEFIPGNYVDAQYGHDLYQQPTYYHENALANSQGGYFQESSSAQPNEPSWMANEVPKDMTEDLFSDAEEALFLLHEKKNERKAMVLEAMKAVSAGAVTPVRSASPQVHQQIHQLDYLDMMEKELQLIEHQQPQEIPHSQIQTLPRQPIPELVRKSSVRLNIPTDESAPPQNNNNNQNKKKPLPPLPPNWNAFVDPATNKVFFWNAVTKESRWKAPTDEDAPSTLEDLLRTAFKIFEGMFISFDADCAGTITFSQLLRKLSAQGFYNTDQLMELFLRVDYDKGGTLDFGEFLMLMYFWSDTGSYTDFVKDKKVAKKMDRALKACEIAFTKYDADSSRELSHDELTNFMKTELPGLVGNTRYITLLKHHMPSKHSILDFRNFLLFLYSLLFPATEALARANADKAPLWNQLQSAFQAMEMDFNFFDTDGSGFIDWTELTMAVSNLKPAAERVDTLAIMTYYFIKVDFDHSESIDFFEFLYLAYLVIKESAYTDMVVRASNAAGVKNALTLLRKAYKDFDKDGSGRLEWDELSGFFTEKFGKIPANSEQLFRRLATGPRENPHIDFISFMRLLYQITCPQGRFAGRDIPKPDLPPPRPVVPAQAPRAKRRPRRFDSVDMKAIRKGEIVGKGGFGTVYKSVYSGLVCAAKFWHEDASEEDLEEARHEMEMLKLFDHDHIVFLVGSHVGKGPLDTVLLTEFCPNGSIFDAYAKRRMKFEPHGQWRFAKEVAMALNILHTMNPPLMHRDVKSANVLLDENYICKLADFGFTCDPKKGNLIRGMGTPHWSAPEVLASTKYDQRADVFSFGIFLWELAHMRIPYASLGWDQATIVKQVVRNNVRPEILMDCHVILKQLCIKCWNRDPAQRPTMAEVITELEFHKRDFGIMDFDLPEPTQTRTAQGGSTAGAGRGGGGGPRTTSDEIHDQIFQLQKLTSADDFQRGLPHTPSGNLYLSSHLPTPKALPPPQPLVRPPCNVVEAAEAGDINLLVRYVTEGHSIIATNNLDDPPLLLAARNGHYECVCALLEAGSPVEIHGDGLSTALHEAAYNNHTKIAMFLLDARANVLCADDGGNTPLHLACFKGNLEMVKLLLRKKGDLNASTMTGSSPLHDAARGVRNDELVALLLASKSNVNLQDEEGITPLHGAAEAGRVAASLLLLDAGADVNAPDSNFNTPLHFSAMGGFGTLALHLVSRGAKASSRNKEGKIPAEVAANEDISNMLWKEFSGTAKLH